jgi:hypothetical protein
MCQFCRWVFKSWVCNSCWGDCVKQGPGTHGCKELSQEKA